MRKPLSIEAIAGFAMLIGSAAVATAGAGSESVHTQRLQYVRRTAFTTDRAAAMFGDGNTHASDDKRGRRRNIERPAAIAASTAGIQRSR